MALLILDCALCVPDVGKSYKESLGDEEEYFDRLLSTDKRFVVERTLPDLACERDEMEGASLLAYGEIYGLSVSVRLEKYLMLGVSLGCEYVELDVEAYAGELEEDRLL